MLPVRLTDFSGYRRGTPWTSDLASKTATFFVADITGLFSREDLSPSGFGGEDLVVTMGSHELTTTLFCVQHGPNPWAEGVLLTSKGAEPPTEGWQPIPVGERGTQRLCLDSGAVVLGAAEALDDVMPTRLEPEATIDLVTRISKSGPVALQDRINFYADVNCHDCWGVGRSGQLSAVYLDFSTTKAP